ncbi:glyoxalase [Bordetella genomosp. 9]|uniref:Glyoxalase n=1 Tax=Bordetella genomosp. 9 TaxID=1416803 RepID=A0A1W6Z5C4_9BORD|nr:glyoxalase [Bordetella genomosp. 9]ARP92578.1 glyoxalase [Bordetella genomosp. 9]
MDLLINIDVDDIARAEAFYRDAFGLRAGRRFGADAVEMLGARVPIYLLRKAAGTAPAPRPAAKRSYERHWTPVHLDFVVTDCDAAVARAVASGARVETPAATQSWGRIAGLVDPFGHGLCILQFIGRGYDAISDCASPPPGQGRPETDNAAAPGGE